MRQELRTHVDQLACRTSNHAGYRLHDRLCIGAVPPYWARYGFAAHAFNAHCADGGSLRPPFRIWRFHVIRNEFLGATVLADRNSLTVRLIIVISKTDFHIDWSVIMAVGVLLEIQPVVFTSVASRQIITGMIPGTVKV